MHTQVKHTQKKHVHTGNHPLLVSSSSPPFPIPPYLSPPRLLFLSRHSAVMSLVTHPVAPLQLPRPPGQTRVLAAVVSYTLLSFWWKRRAAHHGAEEDEEDKRGRREVQKEVRRLSCFMSQKPHRYSRTYANKMLFANIAPMLITASMLT